MRLSVIDLLLAEVISKVASALHILLLAVSLAAIHLMDFLNRFAAKTNCSRVLIKFKHFKNIAKTMTGYNFATQ